MPTQRGAMMRTVSMASPCACMFAPPRAQLARAPLRSAALARPSLLVSSFTQPPCSLTSLCSSMSGEARRTWRSRAAMINGPPPPLPPTELIACQPAAETTLTSLPHRRPRHVGRTFTGLSDVRRAGQQERGLCHCGSRRQFHRQHEGRHSQVCLVWQSNPCICEVAGLQC